MEPKEERALTPAKLAAYYKKMGGNYDCTLLPNLHDRTLIFGIALFIEVPNPSISWIYASIGCQQTLQPGKDDFNPPCIPALTERGFVRWQSIEILLGPEVHVEFIQNTIDNHNIKHPDTGEDFPVGLPKESFHLKRIP
jgi:hypothetical protein